jgi:hypothetical protein
MVKYLDLLVRPNLLDEKIAFTYWRNLSDEN